MKVTKTQYKSTFQPIEIKITIESAEELRILRKITGSNCTVSVCLSKHDIISNEDGKSASTMLAQIYQSL